MVKVNNPCLLCYCSFSADDLKHLLPFVHLASKYCQLLKNEGGLEMLHTVIHDPRPYARIKQLAQIVTENNRHFVEGLPDSTDESDTE